MRYLDYIVKSNRIRQIKVIKKFVYKYKKIYLILSTGDFNSTKSNGDAVCYLMLIVFTILLKMIDLDNGNTLSIDHIKPRIYYN